jgi:eukaryotic translation initiation factor 2C
LNGQQQEFGSDTVSFVSAINLLIRKPTNNPSSFRVGRNKYFALDQPGFHLDLGLEARRGYFMSVRPMPKQLMVNINVCTTAFYMPGNLAQAMIAFRDQVGGMPSHFAKRLKVVTTHLGRPMKRLILCIMGTTPRQVSFFCEVLGGTVTVEQYFNQSRSDV